MTDSRALLQDLYSTAVAAATPAHCMAAWLPERPAGRVVVVGAGKAAASMAAELERHWQGPLGGTVIVPYGHGCSCRGIDVVEAAHPIPDAASVTATRTLLDSVRGLRAEDTVVCLLSGGGSALLVAPIAGVSLSDKQQITTQLLRSGASIHEINAVRKKLSAVKGGKLAAACAPASVLTLIISDVSGNDPAVIASGPTVADTTSFTDVASILHRYGIRTDRALLDAMRASDAARAVVRDSDVRILASSDDALQAAAAEAIQQGLTPYLLGDLNSDARLLAGQHANLAIEIAAGSGPLQAPCVILSGGETTVRVSGRGRGGRNGEYALALALALDGHPRVAALAADTDGIDGNGDNAGCFVFPNTLRDAALQSIDVRQLQENNDSYRFFRSIGDLLVTGPSRTNVNDFRAIVIDG